MKRNESVWVTMVVLLTILAGLVVVPAGQALGAGSCSIGEASTRTLSSGTPTPRGALQAHVDANYDGQTTRDLGEAGNDKYFVHSFESLVPPNTNIVEAYLEMVVTTGDGNDGFHIGDLYAQDRWGRDLVGAGFVVGTKTTKVFDLSVMPVNGSYPKNLVPSIDSNGYVDIDVQDDSIVHSLELTICAKGEFGVCGQGASGTHFAGRGAPSPRAGLLASARNFDEPGLGRIFSHTFTSLAAPNRDIVEAYLEVSATSSDGGADDSINIGRLDGAGGWISPLVDEGFAPNDPTTKLFFLGGLGLLPEINKHGELDVVIRNDTAVDYLELTVCTVAKSQYQPRPWPISACHYSGAPFPATGFADVPAGQFYTDSVAWARANDITNGTSATTFSPGAPVTRAQMAAFLWRLVCERGGSPAAGFVDVPTGAFYTTAVDWLRASGVTTGTTDTTFSPAAPVTRAQMAAFLWRLAGSPAGSPDSGFADVSSGEFYKPAVDWLKAQGITTGTSATAYSPADVVTRAQIATFLYRLAQQPPARAAFEG